MRLSDPVNTIPLVGPRYAQLLEKLEVFTIKDLLYHVPVSYHDSSQLSKISDLEQGRSYTFRAVIEDIRNIRLRHGKTMQKATASDDSGSINITWFNQPFLVTGLKADTEVLLSGKLNPRSLVPELSSPEYEILRSSTQENIHLGRIVPIYHLTGGVSSKWLRSRIKWVYDHIDLIEDLEDKFPADIKEQYGLIDLMDALSKVHFAKDIEDITQARKRLAFDELIEIYFKLFAEREKRLKQKAAKLKPADKLIQQTLNGLPFTLTLSQEKAIAQIYADLAKAYPAKRLLQGDVGSGKTIVAALAALPLIANGYQVAFMVPTTVLANQHYATLQKVLPKTIKIGLVTSASAKSIKGLGKIDLFIGTQALLFQKDKLLTKLGLVIIDEQHRFGVNQRRELLNLKNRNIHPHLLYLTATPIPRTIAQSLFGDLDVSAIEKPAGRKQVQSFLVPEQKRKDSIAWITDKIVKGGQVFWICPLIEETEESGKQKSVLEFYKEVVKRFPKFKVEVLHGKLKAAEKEQIIENFKENITKILVSTTVVEVGIDIPNANLIVIEDAENYGLAQLHQLRGRVGRNNQEAWCLLYTGMDKPEVISRLKFFCSEHDGLKIAEFDLDRRGPGEVYGTMQSGLPVLKVASFTNARLLSESKVVAEELYRRREELSRKSSGEF